jgi:hypothetical protein
MDLDIFFVMGVLVSSSMTPLRLFWNKIQKISDILKGEQATSRI